MATTATLIVSLKIVLISAGFLYLATFMKHSVPCMVDFAVYELPVICSGLVYWLKPPYLYIVVNGIIAVISAVSRFQQNLDDENDRSRPVVVSAIPQNSDLGPDFAAVTASSEFGELKASPVKRRQAFSVVESNEGEALEEFSVVEYSPPVYESEATVIDKKPVLVNGAEVNGDEDEDLLVLSRFTHAPPRRITPPQISTELFFPATEKPPLSSRFGRQKPPKSNPEGERERTAAAAMAMHETMENTWKMITEGRHAPVTRQLTKSDTWSRQSTVSQQLDHLSRQVPKSETFRERTNGRDATPLLLPAAPMPGKVRPEPSLSQDELNRRVEAFIRKVNNDMKIQRQESLNRGVH